MVNEQLASMNGPMQFILPERDIMKKHKQLREEEVELDILIRLQISLLKVLCCFNYNFNES